MAGSSNQQETVCDLSYCDLRSLDIGLEENDRLTHLILDGNLLSDNVTFPQLGHLQSLSLNKNRFQHLAYTLDKISRSFPKLKFLSLLGNPLCPHPVFSSTSTEEHYQMYRRIVIAKLPQLSFLDSTPIPIATPTAAETSAVEDSDSVEIGAEMSEDSQRLAVFDRVHYVYNGKNSEGNRFIRDRHL